jgi:hypothetical protein
MADDWNPDTAGRSLAEILREAGIEAPRSGRRQRRWDDPDDDVVPQRRAGPPRTDDAAFGRRASDVRVADESMPRRRPAPEPSTAAIPNLRGPSRTPDVPGPSTPPVGARPRRPDDRSTGRSRPVDLDRERLTDRDRDRLADRGRDRAAEPDRRAGRAGGRGRDHERPTDRRRPAEPEVESTGRVADRPLGRRPIDPHPSTGPIPVVRGGDAVLDDDEAGPRESATAWLRFAGELIIALAAGVGVYLLATVLWEQLPYLAVVLTPLAVTGLVAGVSVFRRRLGHESMGVPLLAVLVFAGALLTVMPAVTVLNRFG